MFLTPSTGELVALGAPIVLRDGSRVRLRQGHSSDKELLLRGFERWAASSSAVPGHGRFQVTSDVGAAFRDADVIMALRLQRERMAAGLLPSVREYAARYGLNLERLALARPDALVMHPGPMNEGVEITPEVAAHPRSLIGDQVSNGVAVRMALLYLLAGAIDG